MELKFELGKEFEENTPDGRPVNAIVTQEGDNKFVSVQTAKKEGHKSTKTIREFKDTECVMTMEVIGTGVTCTQVFKRL